MDDDGDSRMGFSCVMDCNDECRKVVVVCVSICGWIGRSKK